MHARWNLAFDDWKASGHRSANYPWEGRQSGTGINTHPEFPQRLSHVPSELTGLEFGEAKNHFEAQGGKDAIVEASGASEDHRGKSHEDCKRYPLACLRAALRHWRDHSARTQPGSSIMPGKVNPVIAESVIMVAAQVIGNDAAITITGQSGVLDLNTMMPVMASNLLESIRILGPPRRTSPNAALAGFRPAASAVQNWSSRVRPCARRWRRKSVMMLPADRQGVVC